MPTQESKDGRGLSIGFSNVNGTGSMTAHTLLAQCLNRLGYAIGTKNIFPSNIKGFPTWFELRVSEGQETNRIAPYDILVSMNIKTREQDLLKLKDEGTLFFDASEGYSCQHSNAIGLPLSELALKHLGSEYVNQIQLKNLIYIGAVACYLGLDQKKLEATCQQYFRSKFVAKNLAAIAAGYEFLHTEEKSLKGSAFKDLKLSKSSKVMLSGNEAMALGALRAGASVAAWYPLTPSTSVIESFDKYCQRRHKKGEPKKFAILQAEDETSAMGMVLGASWNGARAFTATSGPGLSLMTEFLGYAFYAELPAVLFHIQRCGPSTGMPTRTQQSDLLSCAFSAHGDAEQVLLIPSTVEECYEFSYLAFNLSEVWTTPVLVVSDLDLGMNSFQSQPLQEISLPPIDRGWIAENGDYEGKPFHRYQSNELGQIPRSFPGKGENVSFFVRGSGHDEWGKYTENSAHYKKNLDRIQTKLKHCAEELPELRCEGQDAPCAVVVYGSSYLPTKEVIEALQQEGVSIALLCLRAFPFSKEVFTTLNGYERILIIEQNQTSQMRTLLFSQFDLINTRIESACLYDGMSLELGVVRKAILEFLEKEV